MLSNPETKAVPVSGTHQKSLCHVRLYSPGDSPGQNTGVGSCCLLQWIFPTQRWNPGLLHCRRILYQLSHQGSPRILEWVAYPFSSGSSWPRSWTGVSCITGGFFTNELWGKHLRKIILNAMYWIIQKQKQSQILVHIRNHLRRTVVIS